MKNRFNTKYPEGSDIVINTLECFGHLKKRQMILLLTQSNLTFNNERANKVIEKLVDLDEIQIENDIISLKDNEEDYNENMFNAFWVLLHYIDDTNLDFIEARYPAEILFKDDDIISEIIVCNDDFASKMEYLSKRKTPKTKSKYYILLMSQTIDEVDEDMFPDVPFALITLENIDNEVPEMVFHDVVIEEI